MEHCTRDGKAKILKECDMPLTAVGCVDTVVTELCIMDICDGKMVVKAMAPGITKEYLQEKTEAELTFAEEISLMEEV